METIVLAEDHNLMVEGYRVLIDKIENLEIVGTAYNGVRAIELIKQHRPNYLILDLHMPKLNGMDVLKYINEYSPSTKVIIISMFGDASIHREAMRLGVKGYILKHSDLNEFMLALNLVMQGKSYFSPAIFEEKGKVKSVPGTGPVIPMVSLTSREKEVLTHIARGCTNKEIAEKLVLSHRTVDTHRSNLMKKIGARNITDIVKYAIANGYDV